MVCVNKIPFGTQKFARLSEPWATVGVDSLTLTTSHSFVCQILLAYLQLIAWVEIIPLVKDSALASKIHSTTMVERHDDRTSLENHHGWWASIVGFAVSSCVGMWITTRRARQPTNTSTSTSTRQPSLSKEQVRKLRQELFCSRLSVSYANSDPLMIMEV